MTELLQHAEVVSSREVTDDLFAAKLVAMDLFDSKALPGRWKDDGRASILDSVAVELDPRVTKREATDLLWAFSNEELYRELVEERGWSPDRFERWLAATLRQQLLSKH